MNYIEFIRSIPKSFYVSAKLMGIKKALNLPIFVRYNCKLLSLTGKVIGGGKFGSLHIGFGRVGIIDSKYQRTILQIDGTVVVDDTEVCSINRGSRLCVCKDAVLRIGKGLHNSAAMTIICEQSITLGANVTTSWDTLIMDTDFHDIRDTKTDVISSCKKPVKIGNNVWICCRSIILKGSVIPNGCIVGANSVVAGIYDTQDSIIAGNPSRIIKMNKTKA